MTVPHRLRNHNFAVTLEALIEYAVDGGEYSFSSDGLDGKLVITVTIDDAEAYRVKLQQVMSEGPLSMSPPEA